MENEPKKLKGIGPYVFYDLVGQGSFSVVRQAMIPGADTVYACKIIPKLKMKERNLAKRFQLEIRVMQQLTHPNIVHIHDIYKDKKFYYVIMEYLSGGTLLEYVVDNRRLDEEESRYIMFQILSSVHHMHLLGICHRDLKPDNILMDSCQKTVKLSDFGLSRFVDSETGLTSTPVGTPCYASPECLSGEPYDAIKSDVWSCGIILFSILTGRIPWVGKNQNQIFNQIKKAKYEMPSYLTYECKLVINACLTVDVNKRPTAGEILDLAWFDSIKNTSSSSALVSIKNIKPSRRISLKTLDKFFGRDLKSGIESIEKHSFNDILNTLSVSNSLDNLIKDFDKAMRQVYFENKEFLIIKRKASSKKSSSKRKKKMERSKSMKIKKPKTSTTSTETDTEVDNETENIDLFNINKNGDQDTNKLKKNNEIDEKSASYIKIGKRNRSKNKNRIHYSSKNRNYDDPVSGIIRDESEFMEFND